jgi:autotransporter translocation and assembly factor TamB
LAVAKDAPGRVFLRWDAVARRARNAETEKRWRVAEARESNLRGDARLIYARPRSDTPETAETPVNWGFLHAGMPKPFAADDFPARHAREFY